jgi:hypothetical protein
MADFDTPGKAYFDGYKECQQEKRKEREYWDNEFND